VAISLRTAPTVELSDADVEAIKAIPTAAFERDERLPNIEPLTVARSSPI
jgi:hypothetical protein